MERREFVQPLKRQLLFRSPFMGEQKNERLERDPENRPVDQEEEREKRDKMMDKTLADSYPASDPPSTIPDPEEDSDAA